MEITALTYTNYEEFKGTLKAELQRTSAGFVRIGYLLRQARDTDILTSSGYASVNDFAKEEFGLDKTMVSRFIAINEKFSKGGYSGELEDKWSDYGYAKLALMLTLPEEVNEELSPEMSKSEIQEIKQGVDAEKKVSDIEVTIEAAQQPAGEETVLQMVILSICKEHPEVFKALYEAYRIPAEDWIQFRPLYEALAPSGVALYSTRIPGLGRMIMNIKDEDQDISLLNVRNNERERIPWDNLHEETSQIFTPMEGSWQEAYTAAFGETPAEVAPVQQPQKVKVDSPKASAPEKKEAPGSRTKPEAKEEPRKAAPVPEKEPKAPENSAPAGENETAEGSRTDSTEEKEPEGSRTAAAEEAEPQAAGLTEEGEAPIQAAGLVEEGEAPLQAAGQAPEDIMPAPDTEETPEAQEPLKVAPVQQPEIPASAVIEDSEERKLWQDFDSKMEAVKEELERPERLRHPDWLASALQLMASIMEELNTIRNRE